MSLPKGLGMYIWQVAACEGGNPDAIAANAVIAGLGHLLIKVCDAHYAWNYDKYNNDLVKPLIPVLKAAGIEPWGWGYVYGNNPPAEADVAIRRVKELGLAGFVVNAEKEFRDRANNKAAATAYMTHLRAGLGDSFPIGLSSYRYPSYHPRFPWREFLTSVDINMPQVYWMQASNPGWQLKRCLDEFKAINPWRPMVPTGSAFSEHGWTATGPQITEFLRTAEDLSLPAANFWSWQHARSRVELWNAVASYDWPQEEPEPEPEPLPYEIPFRRIRCRAQVRIRSVPDTSDPATIIGALWPGDGDAEPLYALQTKPVGADIWIRIGWRQWAAMRYGGTQFLEWVV